jgi:alpha-galactosidase
VSEVAFHEASRTWLLATPNSAYTMRLGDDGLLRHLHWGPPLTIEQAATLPAPARLTLSQFEGRQYDIEELPAEGGAWFGVPAVQVRFADGTRGVELDYADHTIDGTTLTIRFTDRYYGLAVALHYRVHHDTDVIERWTSITNTGGAGAVEVFRADSATWAIPQRDDYALRHVTGHWGGESELERLAPPRGETVLTSRRGNTGHHVNPWLTIDAGDATEEHGEVFGVALAWSGTWRLTVARTATDAVTISGGAGRDGYGFSLTPGGSRDTPVCAGLYSTGGYGAASRAWHRYIRTHVLPHGHELRPVTYNSWEATGFTVDEEGQRRLATQAAAAGVELFVMDDGWFGARVNDHAGLGDWTENPQRFPNGLRPLADDVHRLGMKFGIWVEPEMVNPDSDLYRAHPDWVLHFPHRQRTQLRNQLVLNFARPDVAEWALGWLDELVGGNDVDFLKWDMNRPLTEPGWPDEAGGTDQLWLSYVDNLYGVLDRLRARHPNLRIQSCSGGGGRVDLGVLRRTDEVWPSDNTDAHDRLSIQHGFAQVYPTVTMAAWVTDVPNFLTGRQVPLRFRFHVAMAGVPAIGGDLPEWTDEELTEATGYVAQYKRIARTVQHGDLYRLLAPSWAGPGAAGPRGDGLVASQYVAAEGAESVLFCWLPAGHYGRPVSPVRLRGLDPAGRYRDEETGEVHHGAVLMGYGLRPQLPAGDYASTVTHLVRL